MTGQLDIIHLHHLVILALTNQRPVLYTLQIIAYSVTVHAFQLRHKPGGAIDRERDPHYIDCMTDKTETTGIGEEIDRLESQLELLLDTVDRLLKENRSLRAQQETLTTERANLLEKHDMVRTRVEGMITRLKSMENGA